MTDTWTLRLPWTLPPLLMNQTRRMHWHTHARIVRDIHRDVQQAATAANMPACERIHVRLFYVPRDRRRRDADGLVATLKPLIDALVKAGIAPDDTPEYVTWSPPVIEPANPKDPHLYAVIERMR